MYLFKSTPAASSSARGVGGSEVTLMAALGKKTSKIKRTEKKTTTGRGKRERKSLIGGDGK